MIKVNGKDRILLASLASVSRDQRVSIHCENGGCKTT